MEEKKKWSTPELVEYGNVTQLTKTLVKKADTGDSLSSALSEWFSCDLC